MIRKSYCNYYYQSSLKKASERDISDDPQQMTKDNLYSSIDIKTLMSKAQSGEVSAQTLLGTFYLQGIKVPQNYSEAVRWLKEAASQNSAYAQYLLGDCYALGFGVDKDLSMAFAWYRKAAEGGESKAQYLLGIIYFKEKDYDEAFKWFEAASSDGNIDAYAYCGICWYYGLGIEKNVSIGSKIIRTCADNGSEVAIKFLNNLNNN